ncbi:MULTISPECIES: VOC family protein [Bordetella]|uniref:Dioxygenase n=3 Tax=Bordetella TaxID=517 RepID=A0A0T7CME1_BORP1|nr:MULTISPECIES: VOC family protein [Bordetella]KAK69292.1 glyoxalase-like domain protein [Bordetella bronchiseptica 980-2]KCV28941.1 glyoxalase-like domain protein [Bordetella bronchiseptica 00-P-2730]KDD53180.1 glyoxalase-like domain protein [Bordetella bronchiseptica OSU553]AMG88969.1 glyoxalase [Bordetella bronchiseptica]AWP80011.1 glyoxalase [Bordetella bronchiseptica]
MPVRKLAHYSVRTASLDASRRFYTEILGFKEGYRPAFKFPGVWLYQGGDEADYGVVHLIGVDRDDPQGLADYLGDKDAASLHGSAAIDHLAFLATDLADMRARLANAGLDFRERTVPDLGLHQVFVEDPSGVTIELNYPAAQAMGADAATPHNGDQHATRA